MKTIITSQGATGTRCLAEALVAYSNSNAVVHGHFSLSSLYSKFLWPNTKVERSVIFGTEMRNFYNDLTIEECFEYLTNVFDKNKKNYFFVHTFTIRSLLNKKVNFQNKEIRIVNLSRNPYHVLKSSLNLARNSYENSIVMKKHITRCYGAILNKMNSESIEYADFLSKSIGVKNTMLTLFAVDSVETMLDDCSIAKKLGVESYYIEKLTDDFQVAESFLENFVSEEKAVKKKDVKSFQKSLKNKTNAHVKGKEDKLFEYASKLLDKVLNCNIENYKPNKTKLLEDVSKRNIQNIAIDFYREIDLKDLKLKKEVLETIHNIVEVRLNKKKNTFIKKIITVYKFEGFRGIFKRLKKRMP